MTNARSIGFGAIGYSRIARKAFLPAIARAKHARLVMIGARDPARAEAESAPAGSYEDVLKNPAVEAVYLSLPNALHEEWAVKAAKAGKHVWCEKPAALSYSSAARMRAASAAHGVRLMEGFTFLAHPQHEKVRALIQEGAIGAPTTFFGRFAYPKPPEGDIRLAKELGGGSYYDAAVYPIRASRMLFGTEPERVSARFVFDDTRGVDNRADLLFFYPEGKTAFVSSAFSDYYQSTYEIIGSAGKVALTRAYAVPVDRPVSLTKTQGDALETVEIAAADQFALMLEDFCAEIARGKKTKPYEEELVAQARAVEAGRRAAQSCGVIALSDIT